jgi:hypothetical protein
MIVKSAITVVLHLCTIILLYARDSEECNCGGFASLHYFILPFALDSEECKTAVFALFTIFLALYHFRCFLFESIEGAVFDSCQGYVIFLV